MHPVHQLTRRALCAARAPGVRYRSITTLCWCCGKLADSKASDGPRRSPTWQGSSPSTAGGRTAVGCGDVHATLSSGTATKQPSQIVDSAATTLTVTTAAVCSAQSTAAQEESAGRRRHCISSMRPSRLFAHSNPAIRWFYQPPSGPGMSTRASYEEAMYMGGASYEEVPGVDRTHQPWARMWPSCSPALGPNVALVLTSPGPPMRHVTLGWQAMYGRSHAAAAAAAAAAWDSRDPSRRQPEGSSSVGCAATLDDRLEVGSSASAGSDDPAMGATRRLVVRPPPLSHQWTGTRLPQLARCSCDAADGPSGGTGGRSTAQPGYGGPSTSSTRSVRYAQTADAFDAYSASTGAPMSVSMMCPVGAAGANPNPNLNSGAPMSVSMIGPSALLEPLEEIATPSKRSVLRGEG